MRSSVVLLLLLRALPGLSQDSDLSAINATTVCEVSGSSSRFPTCKGIQGIDKNADICCAEDCLCTCGGSSEDNNGKECFLAGIRDDPPDYCTGDEPSFQACSLPAEPNEDAIACEVVDGVLSDDGYLCCPTGCGLCGGTSCNAMPMSWVQPGLTPLSVNASVPEDATSYDYCCSEIFDVTETICGVDGGEAPCRMPQVFEDHEDSCFVEGISGIAHSSGELCCPIGCAVCGGTGCGEQDISYIFPGDLPWSTTAPEGSTTSDFCCLSAFRDVGMCGVNGVEPPCVIAKEVATLPPRETIFDTCGVDGIEGIADGENCCPLGCGQCGGTGCGSIDMGYITPTLGFEPEESDTSALYCCSKGFVVGITPTCGDEGVLPPCFIQEGTPAPAVAATLSPAALSSLPNTCGLADMAGILDSSETRCCPQGCGMCGGTGCSAVDMDLVAPTVVGGVSPTASSAEYCCTSGVDERDVTCGTGGDEDYYPPCFIPADTVEDSCNVEGVEGVADASRTYCCPLGCGLCGGTGCGSVPESHVFTDGRDFPVNATSASYCCLSSFADIADECGGEMAIEPPCVIPEGTPTPPPVAVEVGDGGDGPLATPSPTTAGSTSRGGVSAPKGDTFTIAPTMAGTVEMMTCETITVMIDDAPELDGTYVMDAMDEQLFVRNDTSALMTYEAYDPETMSLANTTTNSTTESTECGHWVLVEVTDNNFTLVAYPRVMVQDCATHPEDIDTVAMWMVQNTADAEPEGGMMGIVECKDAPATPAPTSAGSNGDAGGEYVGDSATASPTTDFAETASPSAIAADDGGDTPLTPPTPAIAPTAPTPPTPATAPTAPTAPTTIVGNGEDSSSSGSGLSTAEAAGIGIGASAVAIVGVVSLARWRAHASG